MRTLLEGKKGGKRNVARGRLKGENGGGRGKPLGTSPTGGRRERARAFKIPTGEKMFQHWKRRNLQKNGGGKNPRS